MSAPRIRFPAATWARLLALGAGLVVVALTWIASDLISAATPARMDPAGGGAATLGGERRHVQPRMTDPARDTALAAARAALTSYTRTDLPRDIWWKQLAPHLSSSAMTRYRKTNPYTVSVHALSAGGWIVWSTPAVAGRGGDLTLAQIPTAAGAWWVLLSRQDSTAGWKVERFTAPLSAGQ